MEAPAASSSSSSSSSSTAAELGIEDLLVAGTRACSLLGSVELSDVCLRWVGPAGTGESWEIPAHKALLHDVAKLWELVRDAPAAGVVGVRGLSRLAMTLVLHHAYRWELNPEHRKRAKELPMLQLMRVVAEIHDWGCVEVAQYLWHAVVWTRFSTRMSGEDRVASIRLATKLGVKLYALPHDLAGECVKLLSATELAQIVGEVEARMVIRKHAAQRIKDAMSARVKRARIVWLHAHPQATRDERRLVLGSTTVAELTGYPSVMRRHGLSLTKFVPATEGEQE
jgi:hypothetical protein